MKLLCVDGNSILNRAYYGIRELSAKDGTPTNAIYGFFNILAKNIKEVSPDGIVVAFDVHAPTFRHKAYDGYKANRKGMPDDLFVQMPITKELLCYLGYHVCEAEGYEADDILGAISHACDISGNECVIVTGDRDSLQLVRENVTVRLAATKETIVYTPEKIAEVYGVSPQQLIEVKSLMGDSSDNIPGVSGCGEKTALGLIQKFGSLDGVYENIDDGFIKPKMRERLVNDKEQAYMSRSLAEIVFDVPMDLTPEHYLNKPCENAKAAGRFLQLDMASMPTKFGLDASDIKIEPNVGKPKRAACSYKVETNADLAKAREAVEKCEHLDFICDFSGGELSGLKITANGVIFDYNFNIAQAFEQIVCESDKPKRTHDAKPVYRFCLEQGLSIKNIVMDSMLAGYLLDSSSTDYSIQTLKYAYLADFETECELYDSALLPPLCDELSEQIREKDMQSLLLDVEIPFCEVLANMEVTGVNIDKDGVNRFGELLKERIEELTQDIYRIAGEEFNINSTQSLAKILFEKLGLPAKKKTKSGYSTNAQVLESLFDKHPIVPDVLEYRKLTKLYSTYVVGLINEIKSDGRIHSVFKQTETRTGRISSTEPNMQNIPVRTALGREMRKFFVAKDGYMLVDADYSQIELRILADMSGDSEMIDAFNSGKDIHSMTASKVFKIPIDELPQDVRSRAKAINFGIVYGIGAFSLARNIGASVSEASDYINDYFKTYRGVKKFMDETVKKAEENGYVTTMFGRRRELPELNAKNRNVRAFGERAAMNAPIQGTAADIIKIAMIRVFNRIKEECLDAKVILQVHDEIILEASEKDADRALKILCEEMENTVKLKVKLEAQGAAAKSWYLAKQ